LSASGILLAGTLLNAHLVMSQVPAAHSVAETAGKKDDNREDPSAQMNSLRTYGKVITPEAKTQVGVITVHHLRDKWFFEIPVKELGRDFLWAVQAVRGPEGADIGEEAQTKIVRWEQHDDKIFLRGVSYNIVGGTGKTKDAVNAINNSTILMAFPIETYGRDKSPVIDVTKIFSTDGDLGVHKGSADPVRSFVDSISAFPTNLQVGATITYSGSTGVAASKTPLRSKTASGGTWEIHYSLLKLPETAMIPRLKDDRVGYYSVDQTDYGFDEQRVVKRSYITRWRLEKLHPEQKVSDVVRPLVYYIDPATPAKWIPYIKRAVNSWQGAFEEAGFKDAIEAREAPSRAEDPNWSVDDLSHTVIRWIPATEMNAHGVHIVDPRSGEILNGNVYVYQNILNMMRKSYFSQVSSLDPRARRYPFPDDLMGSLLEYVIKHEVGHTLGLMHNMRASSTYPVEKLRDREWVHRMGHCASIMDYCRFNYVAQPEDKIDVADLIPRIGPYDNWAIHWGYAPITADNPDGEKQVLNSWAKEQSKYPWLRYADDRQKDDGVDPGVQSESTGDADPVAASTLGMKNLKRIAESLTDLSIFSDGDSFDDFQSLYGTICEQWNREMRVVTRLVGGFETQTLHVGQSGRLFVPVAKERQREAVKFLNENAFVIPDFLLNPDLTNKLSISSLQSGTNSLSKEPGYLLAELLSFPRFDKMEDALSREGAKSYSPIELFSDLRPGIWKEVMVPGAVHVNIYRRTLQQAYVEQLRLQLSRPGDIRSVYRGELAEVKKIVVAAIPHAGDRMTRLHLEDLLIQISKVLDGKSTQSSTSGSTTSAHELPVDVAVN